MQKMTTPELHRTRDPRGSDSTSRSESPPMLTEKSPRLNDHQRRAVTGTVAVYWIAQFVGTHIPNPEAITGPDVSDKLLHAVACFILTMLLTGRWRLLRGRWPDRREQARLLLIVVGYAFFDEVTQGIPGLNRHPDFYDAIADVSGVCAATAVLSVCRLVTTACRHRTDGQRAADSTDRDKN